MLLKLDGVAPLIKKKTLHWQAPPPGQDLEFDKGGKGWLIDQLLNHLRGSGVGSAVDQ